MRVVMRPPLNHYVVAVVASGLALLLTWLLRPLIDPSPFPLFFGAVAISAWFGGRGPGLLAAFLSALAAGYFFLLPADSLAIADSSALVRLGAFLLVALVISLLNDALRRSQQQLARQIDDRTAELARANAALRSEIAERRRAETRYRVLVETAPDAMVTVDAEGRIVLVNSQTERIFGYRRDELLGQPIEILVPERLRVVHAQHRAGYLVDPHARPMGIGLDLYGRRRDGTEFPVEIALSPLETEEGILVTSVIHDTTDRRRADEERGQLIREQVARAEAEVVQRRLAFLAEASKVLAASLDYETTMTSVARLAVRSLADWCIVDVVEADGTIKRVAAAHADPTKEEQVRQLQHRYPPDPRVPEGVSKVLRTGQSVIYPEVPDSLLVATAQNTEHLEILRRLGSRSSMYVAMVARGRVLGAITFVSSRSGRRYGPADLALAEDLASRAALAVDNARLYHEAQEAIFTRDEFLSSVSHDLKNPLAAIKGHAQLLIKRATRAGTPEATRLAEGLTAIDVSVTKMAALINQLLDMARLQIGQSLVLGRHPVDLVALVRDAVNEYQQATERHHIRPEVAVGKLVGCWDESRLERVIGNLLSNAIKYSPAGGNVTVRVAREESADGSLAVLEVSDQGLGIPAEDLPHVFKWFYRGRNVVGRIAGTGIGLAAVHQIVEQHGGSIAVKSQEGTGSTFTVWLPLPPSEHNAQEGDPCAA